MIRIMALGMIIISGAAQAQAPDQNRRHHLEFLERYFTMACAMYRTSFIMEAQRDGRRVIELPNGGIASDLVFPAERNMPRQSFRIEMRCESKFENGELVTTRREVMKPTPR